MITINEVARNAADWAALCVAIFAIVVVFLFALEVWNSVADERRRK